MKLHFELVNYSGRMTGDSLPNPVREGLPTTQDLAVPGQADLNSH